MTYRLPTVLCVYCGTPTTFTGAKHCDTCHGATKAPIDTLRKIIREHELDELRQIVREELADVEDTLGRVLREVR